MRYKQLAKLYEIVLRKKIQAPADRYIYIISKQIASLGYDVYETADDIEVCTEEARADVQIKESFWGELTTEEPIFEEITEERPEVYMVQHYDIEKRLLKMYFKSLDEWQKVGEVGIYLSGNVDESEEAYNSLMAYFERNSEILMADESNKFLTDLTFREYASKDDWANPFLTQAIHDELVSPSDQIIALIAEDISKNYTTMSHAEVYTLIYSGLKEMGLREFIKEMYGFLEEDEVEYVTEEDDYGYEDDYEDEESYNLED